MASSRLPFEERRCPGRPSSRPTGTPSQRPDFFSVEVLTAGGLVRYLVLFVIELKTRRVHIAGIRSQPDGAWMAQIARNLTDAADGPLRKFGHLIVDRDPLYTVQFRTILKQRAGSNASACLPAAPISTPMPNGSFEPSRTSACGESFALGERHLDRVIREFVVHYHTERNHQGLGNVIPFPANGQTTRTGRIRQRQRLGGLLKFCERDAA